MATLPSQELELLHCNRISTSTHIKLSVFTLSPFYAACSQGVVNNLHTASPGAGKLDDLKPPGTKEGALARKVVDGACRGAPGCPPLNRPGRSPPASRGPPGTPGWSGSPAGPLALGPPICPAPPIMPPGKPWPWCGCCWGCIGTEGIMAIIGIMCCSWCGGPGMKTGAPCCGGTPLA